MSLKVVQTSFFSNSKEKRFNRIITTPLGSRVLRPHFGSKIHELVDKNMDEEFNMLFSKYLLECFFDENHLPWDKELIPKSTKIESLDTTVGVLNASIEFEDENIEFSIGGFK